MVLDWHSSWQAHVGLSVFDVGMPLFLAGATFGDVAESLLLAGAVFAEIWLDSRGAKCCNFLHKMRVQSAKVTSANGRVRDDQLGFGSCSDHSRIVRHCK